MSTLYMYTFMPIIFLIVVTVMWLLHKVKKTKFIKNKPTSEHEGTVNNLAQIPAGDRQPSA